MLRAVWSMGAPGLPTAWATLSSLRQLTLPSSGSLTRLATREHHTASCSAINRSDRNFWHTGAANRFGIPNAVPLSSLSITDLHDEAAELRRMSQTARTQDTRDALLRLAARYAQL